MELTDIQSLILQLDLLINYTPKGVQLNRANLIYLAYLAKYGFIKGREKVLEDGISLNGGVWSNQLNILRSKGLVKGKREESVINPDLKLELNSFKLELDIEYVQEGS